MKYTRTYADLCSFLQNSKDLLEDNTEESKSKAKNLFKSLLFGRIQNAFENQDDQISKGILI